MKSMSFLLICTSVMFAGCEKEDWCNCLKSEGDTRTSQRSVPEFTAIEMLRNVDIILEQGTTPGVEVTCGENLMDGIVTEVRNGTLYIDNINRCNWLRDFDNKFLVKITFTQLSQITNRGSGMLTCADTIRVPYLQTDNWNSTGTMTFLLNCTEVHLKLHTGPADIIAEGKCGILYVYTTGNGFVKAGALDSKYTYVTTESTGDCELSARIELQAQIKYDGDVYYKGNPPLLQYNITGNGRLIQL
jgi:hypothetical protein